MKKLKLQHIIMTIAIGIFLYIGVSNKTPTQLVKIEKDPEVEQVEDLTDSIVENKSLEESKQVKEPKSIYVHLTGAVEKEGLFELKEGARLNDLILMAGGLKDDVDMAKINLSMILSDQMRLHLARLGEEVEINSNNFSQNQAQNQSSQVNINQADQEELMTLPGIGEKKAKDIMTYRKNKSFETIEEIMQVSGIGEKSFEKLKDLIRVR